MATIADNIAELMRIRLEMKEFAKIPDDVPFEQYVAWLAWAGEKAPAQPLMADFVNKRYSMDGVPCRFEDIFEFERLSKAWDFVDGELKEYNIDEPRLSDKGLLIEPKRTNYITRALPVRSTFKFIDNGEYFKFITLGSDVIPLSSYYPQGIGNSDRGVAVYSLTYKSIPNSLGCGPQGYMSAIMTVNGPEHTKRPVGGNRKEFNESKNKVDVVVIGSAAWARAYTIYGGSLKQTHTNADYFHFEAGEEFEIWSMDYTLFPNTEIDVDDVTITSTIKPSSSPTTRLPETLTLKNPNQPIIVDADEGIIQDKGTFTGFGHIRKIEVK